MPEHKMVCLGMDGVGKTAIAVRFLQGTFMEKYDPTVEDSYRKNVQIDNVHYVVEILDTAGLDLMTAMKDLYMKDGQGFILVYDVTNRESFEALNAIRAEIEHVTGSTDFPSIVVGNKCDIEEKRQVPTEEGSAWAHKFEDCSFIEVSAKLSPNIEDIFLHLLQQVLRAEQRRASKPPPAANPTPSAATSSTTSSADDDKIGGKKKKEKGDCVVS